MTPVTAATLRTIGIVGLGLMGGSLARALGQGNGQARPRIIGVDSRDDVRARAASVVDDVHATLEPLAACELVVLCTPVAAIESLLAPVSAVLADGAIITDVGGVKVSVQRAAERIRPGVVFVGAHPMFGGEKSGFDRIARYAGGAVAVCEDSGNEAAIARVSAFFASLGCRIVRCTAEAHDRAVARVSHLPFVTAHALVDAAESPGLAGLARLAAELAGPGFADATRLAGFDFDIQGEVARRNAYLPGAIDDLIDHLRRIRDALPTEAAAHALRRRR